jgi:hypothetical protein
MSLIQSAKLNDHDPYGYLKDVSDRLPTQPAGRIEELPQHMATGGPDMQILSEAERQAVRVVADGDRSQLDSARRAFHRAAPCQEVASCVELQFVSEVLTPVPDLLLRSNYRRAQLRQSA